MRILLGFLFVFGSVLFFGSSASAKEVIVNNSEELEKALLDQDTQLLIKLSPNFKEAPLTTLNIDGNKKVHIIGNRKKYRGVIEVNISVLRLPKIIFSDFKFDGEGKNAVGLKIKSIKNGEGYITINNSTFENSTDAIINVAGRFDDEYIKEIVLILDNVLINNNKSKKSGAINANLSEIRINSSTISNNINSSASVGGGGITAQNVTIMSIQNTTFENNQLTGFSEGKRDIGGGAIYVLDSMDIPRFDHTYYYSDTYFKGNHTNLKDNQHGGAIFYEQDPGEMSLQNRSLISFYGITFDRNKSSGYGGALALGGNYPNNFSNVNSHFSTSVFFENESIITKDGDGGGGAIAEFSTTKTDQLAFVRRLNFIKSTFVKNKTVGNVENGNKAAILINSEKNQSDNTLINFDSTLFGFNTGDLNFNNINSNGIKVNSENTFGIDNGQVIEDQSTSIFGKYPFKLQGNLSEEKVGYLSNRIVIPSIMIIPKFTNNNGEITKGFANERIKKEPDFLDPPFVDFREIQRGVYHSLGPIDTTSILYDANEGNFTLQEMKSFDGEEYYEGANPTQYAKLYLPGSSKAILSGISDLKVKKKGSVFIGWSTNRKAVIPNVKYAPGKITKLDKQLKLYAIWKDLKYNVSFYSNGKTNGSLAKTIHAKPNSEITIPKSVKIKRKGYIFSGWSLKPSSVKADSKLSPGKKIKVTKAMKIYAVWKKVH